MTISFIIPSHNNAELLEKSLAGFAAQEHSDVQWEVFVIDNNSSDISIAALQLKFRKHMKLTLIEQPQLAHPFALCRARNIGLKLAEGQWIVVMDADIIPNPKYIKTLAAYINEWKDRPIISSCERRFVLANDIDAESIIDNPGILERLPLAKSPSNYGLPVDRRLPAMQDLPDIKHPWDYMHGCNVIFRKEDALKIGGYDEKYDGRWGFEDIDFAYRMITEAECTPLYASGLHVYHQDLPEDKPQTNRNAKSENPNWAKICDLIPGYKEYKVAKYRKLSDSIEV